MRTVATLHPRFRTGDGPTSDGVTVLAHFGGYDLVVSTSVAAWSGVSLESIYLGSDRAGYRGSHLVLDRGGHEFAAATHLEAESGPGWWRTGLLDHYAVLQDRLSAAPGLIVCVEIDDCDLAELRV